jgi:hypothetical protein
LPLALAGVSALPVFATLLLFSRERNIHAAVVSSTSVNEPESTPAAATKQFAEKIVPLVAQYCGDCHSGPKSEAKLDLTKYHDAVAVIHDRHIWRKVLTRLSAGEMPPEDQEQPKPEQKSLVEHWIDAQLSRPVPLTEQDPGRVTVHRLNRAEYNNTIRDLLGVDFHPADDFPADDVGYGFDNIGDVLSVSPILLEKYLRAAQHAVEQAMLIPDPPPPAKARFFGLQLQAPKDADLTKRGAARLLSSGEVSVEWHAPREGEYAIRTRALADLVGKETIPIALQVDGKPLKSFEITARTSAAKVYEVRTTLPAGKHRLAVVFVSEPEDAKSAETKGSDSKNDNPKAGDSKSGDAKKTDKQQTDSTADSKKKDGPKKHRRSLSVLVVEAEGPFGGPPPPPPEPYRRLMIALPKSNHPSPDERADSARKILRHFVDRAFRRPAKDDEVDRLMKLWKMADEDTGPLDRSLQIPLAAVLTSPNFLFRAEPDPEPENPKAHRIGDYALASRLSYFLWSSMPDEELLTLAGRGQLHTDEQLAGQVQRMIKDPKSQALVDNFAAQWLQYRRLDAMTPDKSEFGQFDDSLRSAMRRETELFFEHVMRDDRSVIDFLDADYTYVNARLARHYGIPNVTGDNFQRVSTGGSHRGGVLTQASVLLITSNPGRTSPVKRGKWVLENILGTPPPPPPPNVPQLSEEKAVALTGSLRQRTEQHRANAMCAACHKSMDPLGFGLENFDAVGAWRTRDGQFAIDSSGVLPGGKTFAGVDGLKQLLLSRREQFARCLAEKLLTYALGRGLENNDAAAVDQIAYTVAKDGFRFSSLVKEIVRSAPFQMRRGKENGL